MGKELIVGLLGCLTQHRHDLLYTVSLLHEESFPASGRLDSLIRYGSIPGEGLIPRCPPSSVPIQIAIFHAR